MLRFQVQDMTCGHCVSTITETIESALPAKVAIDLPSKTVEVDTTAGVEAVSALIREAGYTPVEAAADAAGAACCGHCH
jgi:copper chaperone